MLAPPKPLLRAGVQLLTYRTARRLRQPQAAVPAQEAAFRSLCQAFAATSYGRDHGLSAHATYADFQQRVPLRTYEGFHPWIERMKAGEADVLAPGQCQHYAVSSGTTAGPTKFLPVNRAMVAHFRRAGLDSLLYYTARVGSASVFRGKHLFLGGATSLTPLTQSPQFSSWGGDLSGITALNLPHWVEHHLYEPGRTIAQMADWPAKIEAIAARTVLRDISLLAGIPSWILILAEALQAHARRQGRRPENLRALWPNFECLVHGGVPITPYAEQLQAAVGPGVHFHEVYPASEGFIAVQDAEAEAGLRLLTDAGLFFEFLPLEEWDETRLEHLGTRAVSLAGVKPNQAYALLLTTPAGLCRYALGDVVRFTSVEPPRLVYAGRTKLQLSAFGEHVIEKELTDALADAARRLGIAVAHFHVAPLFADANAGRPRGAHEWWIEAVHASPVPAELASSLDLALQSRNDDYLAKRQGGGLLPPSVRWVPPGTFERWLRAQQRWGGQNKVARCRSDRVVADALAGVL